MMKVWMAFLVLFLVSLTGWGTFIVEGVEHKILIFGIVGALVTTIISVHSITWILILNHNYQKIPQTHLELFATVISF